MSRVWTCRAAWWSAAGAIIAGVLLVPACAGPDHAKAPPKHETAGTTATPATTPATRAVIPPPVGEIEAPRSLREVFPHVRVDAKAGVLEFDAMVSIDAHDAKKPNVFLETLACITDSKEYESLVVTRARPSHVHAGLLLMGLSPGTPGKWQWTGKSIHAEPPRGPMVKVRMVVNGQETPPGAWVRDLKTGRRMVDTPGGDEFVFAGSVMVGAPGQEHYKADVEGSLVGLTTFGSETIAWTRMSNPESAAEEPHWVADPSMPAFAEAVVVRVTRVDGAK